MSYCCWLIFECAQLVKYRVAFIVEHSQETQCILVPPVCSDCNKRHVGNKRAVILGSFLTDPTCAATICQTVICFFTVAAFSNNVLLSYSKWWEINNIIQSIEQEGQPFRCPSFLFVSQCQTMPSFRERKRERQHFCLFWRVICFANLQH